MKIPVDEIPQSPKEITFSENIEGLNEIFRRNRNPDFGFPPGLDVRLTYYRSGADLFFARGNRDVIIGRRFCRETGSQLLDETTSTPSWSARASPSSWSGV